MTACSLIGLVALALLARRWDGGLLALTPQK
jgi:hypothetical protein